MRGSLAGISGRAPSIGRLITALQMERWVHGDELKCRYSGTSQMRTTRAVVGHAGSLPQAVEDRTGLQRCHLRARRLNRRSPSTNNTSEWPDAIAAATDLIATATAPIATESGERAGAGGRRADARRCGRARAACNTVGYQPLRFRECGRAIFPCAYRPAAS